MNILFLFLISLLSVQSLLSLRSEKMKVVENVDLEKLRGRWYSAYSNSAAKFLMKRADASCGTLDIFEGSNDRRFLFVESYQLSSERETMSGDGHVIDKQKQGKLRMLLHGLEALQEIDESYDEMTKPNVLIISIGPVKDNSYEYFISTDPLGVSLSVFVRGKDSLDEHDEEIRNKLNELEFDLPETRPVKSEQENCNYIEMAPPFVEDFNINRFIGRYFMVVLNPFVQLMNKFTFHAKCITLDLTRKNRTALNVVRSKIDTISEVYVEEVETLLMDKKLPGQLLITGQTTSSGLKISILKTGQLLQTTGQYEYIIATDQTCLGVVVLSPLNDIMERNREEIENFLDRRGYNKIYNLPVEVDHSHCTYRPRDDTKPNEEWEYIRFRGVLSF